MRVAILLGGVLLGGCSSTTFAEPRIQVAPYLAVYELRGGTRMQSRPVPSGPVQSNPEQSMGQFGQERHDSDVGVRVDIGDGFGGLRFDYYKMDMFTSRNGTLTADWGALLATDFVHMTVEMDELRIGYLEPVWAATTQWRDQPLQLKVAAGGVFAHRSMAMRATTDDQMRRQNAHPEGDNLYPAARFRAEWRDFAFDADYAISPNLAIGGDFTDTLQDLELRLSYTIPLRDITVFGAYRYSTLPASGREGDFAWENDFTLEGFQFGLQVLF